MNWTAQPGLPDCPQLKILRLNGSIFFGAVNHLQESLQSIDEINPNHKHVLLVASGINFIDLAGAHFLEQEATRRRALGGGLYLFDLKAEPMEMLQRSGALATIGAFGFGLHGMHHFRFHAFAIRADVLIDGG